MSDYSNRSRNREPLQRDLTIDPPFHDLHIRENLEDVIIRAGIIFVTVGSVYGAIKLADYYHFFGFALK